MHSQRLRYDPHIAAVYYFLGADKTMDTDFVMCIYVGKHAYTYTECHRRNGQNFGRVFLMLNYTDITQNTYIQS